jgi:uncharacterized protein YbbK (DUF523 family)
MSTVRMCDRCGEVFSEREDGWTTMTGTTMRRDEKGDMKRTTEQLDACPGCSAGSGVPRPTIRELQAGAGDPAPA